MSKSRTTIGKRVRQDQKRAKAQAKVERRAERGTLQADSGDAPLSRASESDLIAQLASLHEALESGNVDLSEFEERRDNIRTELERLP
jgi:hypothetical protein